jgi:hypothetical protein
MFEAGSGSNVTMRENRRAFEEVLFRPRAAVFHREREIGTTVLGHEISMPAIVSSVGFLKAGQRRVRRASSRVARRTLVWRGHSALVVRESENADHLDLLGGSCLLLARFAPSLTPSERQAVEPSVRGLAGVLDELAHEVGDRETRQRAAERALAVANAVSGADAPAGSTLAGAVMGVRLAATDLMVFAGVNLDDAVEAVREGILEQQVAEDSPAPRRRFPRLRRLLTR